MKAYVPIPVEAMLVSSSVQCRVGQLIEYAATAAGGFGILINTPHDRIKRTTPIAVSVATSTWAM